MLALAFPDLPDWHIEALLWFQQNAGRSFARRPVDVGLKVKVTDPWGKGIRKPAGSAYALSVLQTHKGVYADEDPIYLEDGSWIYLYHQEGKTTEELAHPETLPTNAGLFKCSTDDVPVGVVVPSTDRRGYTVLGLATVGVFDPLTNLYTLSGPVRVEATESAGTSGTSEVTVALIDFPTADFDPTRIEDARQRTLAEVRRRQGQPRFRRVLLRAYEGRCAMSDYDAEPALEAAHILSYRGASSNHPANGLLLRADLHDLFDLGLVAVDTSSMRLLAADALLGTMYESLSERRLRLPRERELQPSFEALDRQRESSAVA